jgi:hypothetical protein
MPQRARIARIAGARETRQLTAVRVGPGAIQVDGSLDDPGWAGTAYTFGVTAGGTRFDHAVDRRDRRAGVLAADRERSSQVASTGWLERLELLAQRR